MTNRNKKSRITVAGSLPSIGLHTESSEPFAARPSERLSVAYTEGAESSEVLYLGFLYERHPPPYNPNMLKSEVEH
jgi:hypothetical protein